MAVTLPKLTKTANIQVMVQFSIKIQYLNSNLMLYVRFTCLCKTEQEPIILCFFFNMIRPTKVPTSKLIFTVEIELLVLLTNF